MTWTSEWPTEPGRYWFYGRTFGRQEFERFYHIGVHVTANDFLVYIAEGGHILSKVEGAEGVWQPVTLPEPPRNEEALR